MELANRPVIGRAWQLLSRRQVLVTAAGALTAIVVPRRVRAQDAAYARAVERTLGELGEIAASVARIAPATEPGPALAIAGRLFAADGETPLGGRIVLAYHTDRNGLYEAAGAPPHAWRLRGAARTDAGGAFEFRTIRPAPYPGGRIPAHVHFVLVDDDARYSGGELRFTDDAIVEDGEKAASARAGRFAWVRPVQSGRADINLRIEPARRL